MKSMKKTKRVNSLIMLIFLIMSSIVKLHASRPNRKPEKTCGEIASLEVKSFLAKSPPLPSIFHPVWLAPRLGGLAIVTGIIWFSSYSECILKRDKDSNL